MGMLQRVTLTGAMLVGLSTGAIAAPQSALVRGTVTSVNGDTVAVKTYEGTTANVMLTAGTKYAWVVRSSLSDLKKGDFIGSGATGPDSKLVAMEVVIFPASMRGAGEGHYPWSVPAAVAHADAAGGTQSSGQTAPVGPPVQGTMTNGTIAEATSPTGGPPVQGTMTNGTVAEARGAPAGRELTVTYNNGQKIQIHVPANVPVVRFELAHKSIVKAGEKVFVHGTKAAPDSAVTANFVAVGKGGLRPPM